MIKISSRFIFAALAAIVVLASSCAKEIPVGQGSDPEIPAAEGSRVISVSFAPQTKTALGEDGLTPEFVDGDEIFLCTNPKNQEEIKTENRTVSVNKEGKATISTNLAGELTAIYPAKGAEYFDKLERYDIGVPQIQSGRFADANICKATIAAGGGIAQFKNQFALFVITPPEGTQKLTIKSLPTIGDDGQRSGSAKFVNNLASGDGMYYVTVETPPAEGKYYVALLNGAKLSDLSFEAEFATDGTGSIKGIPMKAIEEAKAVNITASGTMYTINENNWHEYVTIGGKKWATENIGATDSDPYGTYFMWGAVEKAYISLSDKTFTFGDKPSSYDNSTWNTEKGFVWDNCNFTDGVYIKDSNKAVFTKYTSNNTYAKSGKADNKVVLDLTDDAAYVNWGGAWRMPTGGTDATADFTALANACKTYTSGTLTYSGKVTEEPTSKGIYYYNVSGGKGVYLVADSNHKLFFPAVGGGRSDDNKLFNPDYHGNYWSSTLCSSNQNAYIFRIEGELLNPQNNFSRCHGRTIRPVAD